VESWHRILKSKYLARTERYRVDKVIQIFKDDVIPNYQMAATQVHRGIRKQTVNKFQLRTKGLGESYTGHFLMVLGVNIIQYSNYVSSSHSPHPYTMFT
jgi:hypothetical protein